MNKLTSDELHYTIEKVQNAIAEMDGDRRMAGEIGDDKVRGILSGAVSQLVQARDDLIEVYSGRFVPLGQ